VADWRTDLRALAALGETDLFPLQVYRVNPPSHSPWPAELAQPSAAVREFYQICDGGYVGGLHRWLAVGELLPENRQWWDLLARYPRPGGGPLAPARYVILAYDASGFPVVWDRETDRLVTFFFKDRDDLDPPGPTLDELLSGIFSPDYFDEMWQEALIQLRGHAGPGAAPVWRGIWAFPGPYLTQPRWPVCFLGNPATAAPEASAT
jgi:hypothetical protein